MRESFLSLLACPTCGGDVDLRIDVAEGDEAMEGAVVCASCVASFPLRAGVPRMNEEMENLENVARTFGYEWRSHHQGRFESDTLFGRTLEEDWHYFLDGLGIEHGDVVGASVLDAGCGSGSFSRLVGARGAGLVVGLDINDAVDDAFAYCRGHEQVHIVQGNVFRPPFKPGVFDLAWCNGVLHHTPDAARGHRALARLVRPGGRFYVWVYPDRFNPFRLVKDVLDAVRVTRLPEPVLYRISRAISYPSFGLLQVYRSVRSLPGLQPRTAWGARTVRSRSLAEIQLTWFDALSPEYDTRHSEEEVMGWFARAGYSDVEAIVEPKVGVRGRATEASVLAEAS